MNDRDRQFLSRADNVSENYRERIAKIESKLRHFLISSDRTDIMSEMEAYRNLNRFLILKREYRSHIQRLAGLLEEQRRTQSIKDLCVSSSRRAGTDGANFMTMIRNLNKEPTDEGFD